MSSVNSSRKTATRPFSAFSRPAAAGGNAENEKRTTHCAIFRYDGFSFDVLVGEFIDPISNGSFGLFSSLVGAAALGMFAIWQSDTENDDDDSTPGGGLMQPIA